MSATRVRTRMPLGFERLNVRKQPPNPFINFIKPLEGPDKDTSLDFLSRVAAISVPIMRSNHVVVMSLEEFEPNREFWGRNFNAGEVIQLVLRSPSTGRWLPFRFVQMVFMHELAHCKQMNHSGAFWKVRNAYSAELRVLWDKNYIGDGLWGRGRSLYDGQYTQDTMPATDEPVRNLCGGTYRGFRGKRKRKSKAQTTKLSYAEQKQKRIAKRFGAVGTALGDDEITRAKLENWQVKGKPRVAGSNRGRELRAAAALARLEQSNTVAAEKEETDEDSETESESDYEELQQGEEAKDAKGLNILDSKGHKLVKVCENEDPAKDVDARRELEELGSIPEPHDDRNRDEPSSKNEDNLPAKVDEPQEDILLAAPRVDATIGIRKITRTDQVADSNNLQVQSTDEEPSTNPRKWGIKTEPAEALNEGAQISSPMKMTETKAEPSEGSPSTGCPVCSLDNELAAITCAACAHVLRTDSLVDYWKCHSAACSGSPYINAGDVRLCGICGTSKSTFQ